MKRIGILPEMRASNVSRFPPSSYLFEREQRIAGLLTGVRNHVIKSVRSSIQVAFPLPPTPSHLPLVTLDRGVGLTKSFPTSRNCGDPPVLIFSGVVT